jgi:hypothetical protein
MIVRMDDSLPRDSERRRTDLEQVKILSVVHFVGVGLAALGLLVVYGHYKFLSQMISNPNLWKGAATPPPPEAFAPLRWMYGFGATIVAGTGVLNFCAARWLRAKKNRVFTIGVAIVNCCWFPIGTALGVFTIIVLARESTQALYRESAPSMRE